MMSEHHGVAECLAIPLSIMILLACTMIASANPVAPPRWHQEKSNDFSVIFTLFLLNLPWDLALFALALLGIALALGKRVGKVSGRFRNFAGLTILAGFVIAPVGAIIDYCFAYSWNPWQGETWIMYDPVMWFLGTFLIFASVALTYVLLLGIRPYVALIPSLAVAVTSPVAWYLESDSQGSLFYSILCGTIWIFGGAIAFLGLLGLRRWHKKTFPRQDGE